MFDLGDLKIQLQKNVFIGTIDTVPKGHIRINTGFIYPDGSSIDIFLDKNSLTHENTKPVLTDFGSTLSWLDNMEIDPLGTEAYKIHSANLFHNHNCEFVDGAIRLQLNTMQELTLGIFHIGQACLRFADFIYTIRTRKSVSRFKETVENYLMKHNQIYVKDREIKLNNGNVVSIDFSIMQEKNEAAILTLPKFNSNQGHTKALEIYATWIDLHEEADWARKGGKMITLHEEESKLRSYDLVRLERKSKVIGFSETGTDTIHEVLAA